MKRLNFLAWSSLLFAGILVGCSETDAPATGGGMKRDGAMQGGDMMKDGDMKGGGMMKDDEKMMKEEGK